MQFSIVRSFFNVPVVISVHGHVIEGTLSEASPPSVNVVVLTQIPSASQVYDGYYLTETALVEVASIDIIRALTTVVPQ